MIPKLRDNSCKVKQQSFFLPKNFAGAEAEEGKGPLSMERNLHPGVLVGSLTQSSQEAMEVYLAVILY